MKIRGGSSRYLPPTVPLCITSHNSLVDIYDLELGREVGEEGSGGGEEEGNDEKRSE